MVGVLVGATVARLNAGGGDILVFTEATVALAFSICVGIAIKDDSKICIGFLAAGTRDIGEVLGSFSYGTDVLRDRKGRVIRDRSGRRHVWCILDCRVGSAQCPVSRVVLERSWCTQLTKMLGGTRIHRERSMIPGLDQALSLSRNRRSYRQSLGRRRRIRERVGKSMKTRTWRGNAGRGSGGWT